MSKPPKVNPRDNVFSKTDRRMLLKTMEKFYHVTLFTYNFNLKYPRNSSVTSLKAMERQYRLRVRSIEHILYLMGSDFMTNVKHTNFRKTSETNARQLGLFQGIGETMDY